MDPPRFAELASVGDCVVEGFNATGERGLPAFRMEEGKMFSKDGSGTRESAILR